MADNQGDEGRPESNSGDLDKSLQERIKRRAQADWPGPGAWAAHRRRGPHRHGIVFAFLLIGAGDAKPTLGKHSGERRHSSAANANQVNVFC